MCGRFAFYSPAEAVSRLFGVDEVPALEPRFNIAPTQFVPVVRADDDGGRRISMLHWGLVPFWAKDKSIGNRMINARAETVAEKPAYKDSFRSRRCIVPANGFYEWKKMADGKQPFFINFGGQQLLGLAGLWSGWRSPQDPEQRLDSFTIITTAASPKVANLHDRMPVILNPDDYAAWLAPNNQDTNALQDLLLPCNAPQLQSWPVSRAVNNARNESAALVEPVTLPGN